MSLLDLDTSLPSQHAPNTQTQKRSGDPFGNLLDLSGPASASSNICPPPGFQTGLLVPEGEDFSNQAMRNQSIGLSSSPIQIHPSSTSNALHATSTTHSPLPFHFEAASAPDQVTQTAQPIDLSLIQPPDPSSETVSGETSQPPPISAATTGLVSKKLRALRTFDHAMNIPDSPDIPAVSVVEELLALRPHTALQSMKSLQKKEELLIAAVSVCEGGVLAETLFFLRSTLKRQLFADLLVRHPVALAYYKTYLLQSGDFDTLSLTLRDASWEKAKMLLFEAYLEGNSSKRLEMLSKCLDEISEVESLKFEAQMLRDQCELLARQIKIEEFDARIAAQGTEQVYSHFPRPCILHIPLASMLDYCLFYHPTEDKKKLSSPKGLQERFQITEKKFQWHTLKARARIGDWASIMRMVEKKKFFRGTTYESSIGWTPLVQMAILHSAPDDVVSFFLSKLEDLQERYDTSIAHRMWSNAIDAAVALRDPDTMRELRQRITDTLGPQEAMMFQGRIDTLLADRKIKWRVGGVRQPVSFRKKRTSIFS
eukprot:Rmarinus@m.13955